MINQNMQDLKETILHAKDVDNLPLADCQKITALVETFKTLDLPNLDKIKGLRFKAEEMGYWLSLAAAVRLLGLAEGR